jgi:hypothetical protein
MITDAQLYDSPIRRFLANPLNSTMNATFQLGRIIMVHRALKWFGRAYPGHEISADAHRWLQPLAYRNHIRVELDFTHWAVLYFATDPFEHPIHVLSRRLYLSLYCPTCEAQLSGGWASSRRLRDGLDRLLAAASASGHRCHHAG